MLMLMAMAQVMIMLSMLKYQHLRHGRSSMLMFTECCPLFADCCHDLLLSMSSRSCPERASIKQHTAALHVSGTRLSCYPAEQLQGWLLQMLLTYCLPA